MKTYFQKISKIELNQIRTIGEQVAWKDWIYEMNKYVLNFQQFETWVLNWKHSHLEIRKNDNVSNSVNVIMVILLHPVGGNRCLRRQACQTKQKLEKVYVYKGRTKKQN